MAKPKAVQADNDIGHNSGEMAEKDRKVLFFINRNQYVRLLAAKKAADAALKNHGKQIKADLGDNGLAQIKLYEMARTPEGEAKIKAEMVAMREAMSWAGMPVNTQADLFADLAPLDERAFKDGEESGLRSDTLENPYDANSQHGREFKRGWEAGQEKLGAGIKKKEAEASTDEHIPGHDDSDDPFEDDASRPAAE